MRRPITLILLAAAVAACGGSDKVSGPPAPRPVIDSIAPARGTVGTVVTLHGSAFETGAVRVYFGSLLSPKVDRQGNLLYATAPEGLVLGTTYDVRALNPGGGADTLLASFQAVAPTVGRVNGVTKPTGLVGMTVLIEGDAFGDARHGKVFFAAAGGVKLQAVIADSVNDWTNSYIVTAVPNGTPSSSQIVVETATGSSSAIAFNLISGATFSPSVINWTQTSALPQALQGLGAAFVPAANAAVNASNYIFVVGGAADLTNVATTRVYRADAQQTGALSAWSSSVGQLPEARAYHAAVAATAYTAPIDTTAGNGYLYVVGGVDAAGAVKSSVYYSRIALDGSLGPWQTTSPLPTPLHSARAVVFRGFIYLCGGIDAQGAPTTGAYRASVAADGTIGNWLPMTGLPNAEGFHALLNFGPYLYATGGDAGSVSTMQATVSGGELSASYLARVNLRTGDLTGAWSPLSSMNKGRSKHNTLVAGAYLFTTSGVYAGSPGSSENTYSQINADGTISSWAGATGTNTIGSLLGYDVYNQAAVSFVDAGGRGHVLVLGGAKRQDPGRASAAVVYY